MNPIPRSRQDKFRPCPQCGCNMLRRSLHANCSECRARGQQRRPLPIDKVHRRTKIDDLQQRAALGLPLFEE